MFSLALASSSIAAAYVGGVLLGAGWAIYYIVAPIHIIHSVVPTARVKYLTLLSGAQMFGVGAAPEAVTCR
jgi:hypothetical protein